MGGYPALAIRPPEAPLQQLGQAQQIVGQRQELQTQALQQQMLRQQITDQKALTDAMTQWDGKNTQELPMLVLRSGGSGTAAMGLSSQVLGMREKASQIAKDDAATALSTADAITKQNDQYRGRLLNIIGMKDPAGKQASWDQEVTAEEQAGSIKPGQLPHQYPGDDNATAMANHFAMGSQLVKEEIEKRGKALEAWKAVGGGLQNVLTGERIGGIDVNQLNSAIDTRWQVYHPGEKAPDQFRLQPNATPQDFERIDKLLQSTEEAARQKMTHEDAEKQLAVSNGIRQQMFDLSQDKQGLKPVTGTDPKTGQVVAVPYSQAVKMGIPDAGEMPPDAYKRTLMGRQWLKLALTEAPKDAPPSDMGVSQLIDKMDKEGKLGPLAGRWEDFMTKGWGAGDADYAALKAKMDLSGTLLGVVHTGRLGPYLLEELSGMAQAKKMDGETLKSAFNSEINYVKDLAMDPNPPSYKQAAPAAAPKTAMPTPQTHSVSLAAALKNHPGSTEAQVRDWAKKNGYEVVP